MKLELNNVCKSYGDKPVLKDINLMLTDVHSLGIIGPSGGGKSTLLRLLAGLEKVDRGSIKVNDIPLKNDDGYLNDYRKTLGVVFQAYNLFPHLTAKANVTLPLIKAQGLEEGQAKEITDFLFSKFLLTEHMEKMPHQLSGGQQQRVAIIRALASDPQLLLLDEPTSALDPELTDEVLKTIHQVKKEKRDLILVTHHMEFAQRLCDYLIFIEDGVIVEHNTNKEFFNNPQSERLTRFLNLVLWEKDEFL